MMANGEGRIVEPHGNARESGQGDKRLCADLCTVIECADVRLGARTVQAHKVKFR